MTFTVTDAALERIATTIAAHEGEALALKVGVAGRRFGRFVYDMSLVQAENQGDDVEVRPSSPRIVVDGNSVADLDGATLDFVEMGGTGGFMIQNPNPLWRDPIAMRVQEVIDGDVNPALRAHGGIVSLVSLEDGVAYVAFGGGCRGCGLVDVTLRDGVEARIKEAVPEVAAVVDTTDHGRPSGDDVPDQPAPGPSSPGSRTG